MHLSVKVIAYIKIVPFLAKAKFTIANRKALEFCRGSLKANLLPIIKYDVSPTFVDAICRVYVHVYCCLQSSVDLVATTIH